MTRAPNDALAHLNACFEGSEAFQLNANTVDEMLARLEENRTVPPGTRSFIPVSPRALHELLMVWKAVRMRT